MEEENYNFIDEYGGTKDLYFNRNLFVKHDNSENEKQFYNDFVNRFKNTDVYKRVYSSDTNNVDDSLLYGPLYIDFDKDIQTDKDYITVRVDITLAIDKLMRDFKIPEDMIEIYFSGSKGFHIIIDPIVFGIKPSKDLNMSYKIMALELRKETGYKTIDTRIYDKSRLFRISNSINSKTGLYKVPISLSCLRRFTRNEMYDYAKNPKIVKPKKVSTIKEASDLYNSILKTIERAAFNSSVRKKRQTDKRKLNAPRNENRELLPCVVSGIQDGACKGSRNNTLVALASALFQHGADKDEIIEYLTTWNQNNDPPLPTAEFNTTINSAERMHANDKVYGCEAFKNLGLCISEECKLFNKGE